MIKQMKPAERKNLNPRVVFFAGKAAPGCRSIMQPLVTGLIFRRLHCQADYSSRCQRRPYYQC